MTVSAARNTPQTMAVVSRATDERWRPRHQSARTSPSASTLAPRYYTTGQKSTVAAVDLKRLMGELFVIVVCASKRRTRLVRATGDTMGDGV